MSVSLTEKKKPICPIEILKLNRLCNNKHRQGFDGYRILKEHSLCPNKIHIYQNDRLENNIHNEHGEFSIFKSLQEKFHEPANSYMYVANISLQIYEF